MAKPKHASTPSVIIVDSTIARYCLLWALTTPSRFCSHYCRLHRSTILSALGPDHALTVLFLGTHMRTSQWVTHHGNALTRTRLTSEFRWNPKPVSSQNTSC
ncbi:hypothetical protein DVH24_002964 [Malus domestica]|uniref:Uncharacterized protein n=1 Tax=Malus domestica TaxID=3750 RepID=A0A498K677_MALDO|nr:hypothetical protein DVH24_002964 [Malus domestica]